MRSGRLAIAVIAVTWALLPAPAHGCEVAHHTWRFFLGWTDKGLMYVEASLNRLNEAERGRGRYRERWRGRVALSRLAPGQARPERQQRLPAIDTRRLDAALRSAYASGLEIASRMKGFRAAGMPRQFACDFERKCGVIELETNKAGHLVIQVNGARLPIDMSTNALAPPALNRPLPDEDPVPYSPCDCSVPIGGEGADNYGISRGLFYPRPDGERGGALVLDLAFGDTRLGVTDATWPPCGCRKVKDCMPIADTTHHGTHFEVVLPIDSAIPPPPPEPEPPSPGPLTTLDLDAAARQAKVVAPRTDGIYATVPVCSTGRRWERRFVAFFGDGHAHTLESNESPLSALRTIEHGLMITPHGRYHVTGSRITSKLFDDMAEEREGAKPRASFDAVVMDGGLHIQLKEPKPDARVESYRFVPVKSGVESHSCSF